MLSIIDNGFNVWVKIDRTMPFKIFIKKVERETGLEYKGVAEVDTNYIILSSFQKELDFWKNYKCGDISKRKRLSIPTTSINF